MPTSILSQIKFYFEMCSMVSFDDITSLPLFECNDEPSKKLMYKESYDIIHEYLLGNAYIDFDRYFTQHVIEGEMVKQYTNANLSDYQRKKFRTYLCRSSFENFTDHIPISPPEEMYDYMFECLVDSILSYPLNTQLNIMKILNEYADGIFPDKE